MLLFSKNLDFPVAIAFELFSIESDISCYKGQFQDHQNLSYYQSITFSIFH